MPRYLPQRYGDHLWKLLQWRLRDIQSFCFENSAHGASIFNMTAEAFCYSRIANVCLPSVDHKLPPADIIQPTVDVFEKRMAALEGGAAALAARCVVSHLSAFPSITVIQLRTSSAFHDSDGTNPSWEQHRYCIRCLQLLIAHTQPSTSPFRDRGTVR